MLINDPPLTDTTLKEATLTEQQSISPLISGLVYEKSIMMLVAEAGLGKSVISLNLALQMSCGMFGFGHLVTHKPLLVYYIMFERYAYEIIERIKCMEQNIAWNEKNLVIDDKMKGINVLKDSDIDIVCNRVESYSYKSPDVIMLDPIYACVAGGLSKDEPASQFCRFCNILQARFGSALWLNHHSSRQTYAQDGSKVEKDKNYYGSTWLSALVTGMYEMTQRKDIGCLLTCKKDSHGNLLKEIPLSFDHETYCSFLDEDSTDLSKTERLNKYLNKMYNEHREFVFNDMLKHSGISKKYIYELLKNTPYSASIISTKSTGKQSYYKVIKPF
jgi:RecA-family ATPase